MKTRTAFVSNSSSSSFVLVGLPFKAKDMEKKFGEDFYEAVDVDGFDYLGEEEVFGIMIATGSSDGEYLTERILSIDEITENAQKVADYLGCKVSDVKLITGERMC